MIPSQTWYPSNLVERAAFHATFSTNFNSVAGTLGLSDFKDEVAADAAMMQFLNESNNQVNNFDDAVRQYRKLLTEGAVGSQPPEFPPLPALSPPTAVPPGIFERIDRLRAKIMAADNYTDEIGAHLGLLSQRRESLAPSDVKPTLAITPAKTGFLFSVVVGGRAGADSWEVLVRRTGIEKWTSVKTATGKSVDVVIDPTTPDRPEQIQVMIRLRKNNANYGQPSDIVPTTVSP